MNRFSHLPPIERVKLHETHLCFLQERRGEERKICELIGSIGPLLHRPDLLQSFKAGLQILLKDPTRMSPPVRNLAVRSRTQALPQSKLQSESPKVYTFHLIGTSAPVVDYENHTWGASVYGT